MSGPSEVRALMSRNGTVSWQCTCNAHVHDSEFIFGDMKIRHTGDDIGQLLYGLASACNPRKLSGTALTYLSRRSSLDERGSNFNCAHFDQSTKKKNSIYRKWSKRKMRRNEGVISLQVVLMLILRGCCGRVDTRTARRRSAIIIPVFSPNPNTRVKCTALVLLLEALDWKMIM